MKIDFVKASPSKNMTILITSYVAPSDYPQVAHTLMDYEYVNAEQVGFVVAPKGENALIRLAMSGGEFCGNGLLAAAAYCRYIGLTEAHRFMLETTGVDIPLECFVEAKSTHLFEAKAAMPQPNAIHELQLTVNGEVISGSVVEMDGISHFLTDQWLPDKDFHPIMDEMIKRIDNSAVGLIPYRKSEEGVYEMRPFVYVKETGSRFFEQACGSGSLALGIYLSKIMDENVFHFVQPGGVIKTETGVTNYISTPVRFTCEGSCMID